MVSSIGSELLNAPSLDALGILDYGLHAQAPLDALARGTKNLGLTCYGNSLLRSLASISRIHAWAQQHAAACADGAGCCLCLLHSDLTSLCNSSNASFDPQVMLQRRLWAPDFVAIAPQCPREAFSRLIDKCRAIDEQVLQSLCLDYNRSSLFTLPGWDIFGALVKRRNECTSCGRLCVRHDYEDFMSVAIPSGREVTVYRALADEQEPEALRVDDRCVRCKHTACMTRQMTVVRWPRVLVVQFKRWSVGAMGRRFTKNSQPVAFDTHLVINLKPYILRSVIVHQGHGWGSGHYVAFVSHGLEWYLTDDSACPIEVPWDVVQKQVAYMLFYEAEDVHQGQVF